MCGAATGPKIDAQKPTHSKMSPLSVDYPATMSVNIPASTELNNLGLLGKCKLYSIYYLYVTKVYQNHQSIEVGSDMTEI